MKRLAGIFTVRRWAVNPFQMYCLSFLVAAATAQITLGATPSSVQADLDVKTLLALAVCNVAGGAIALFGLHLRELEAALWVELWGYVCLVFVMGIYLMMLADQRINVSASYGFALSEAFVFAAIHRSVQILLYKRATRKHRDLRRATDLLMQALPRHPVEGDVDYE